MRRSANQASKHPTSSPVFGMRFLTEEELKFSVVGCLGSPTTPSLAELSRESAGSLTIRLCGDGGDTDAYPADDVIESR